MCNSCYGWIRRAYDGEHDPTSLDFYKFYNILVSGPLPERLHSEFPDIFPPNAPTYNRATLVLRDIACPICKTAASELIESSPQHIEDSKNTAIRRHKKNATSSPASLGNQYGSPLYAQTHPGCLCSLYFTRRTDNKFDKAFPSITLSPISGRVITGFSGSFPELVDYIIDNIHKIIDNPEAEAETGAESAPQSLASKEDLEKQYKNKTITLDEFHTGMEALLDNDMISQEDYWKHLIDTEPTEVQTTEIQEEQPQELVEEEESFEE